MPLADQFWGDRYGQVEDPFGHVWSIGATKKKMSDEEIKQAARAQFS
jgi:PhnB protein